MAKRICAFTGHRPRKFPWRNNEAVGDCVELKKVLAEQIKKLADNGVTDFLTGLALGVDTWAALSVLGLQKENPALKLHCILPGREQADPWTVSERGVYQSILEQADSVVYVNRNYTRNCMLERNHFLVDHCDFLLAVYNGERRGGTAATVRYAQKANREIIVIDPISRDIRFGAGAYP